MNISTLNKLVDLSYKIIHLPSGRFRHFSYIVRRNKIICIGVNCSEKTHTLSYKFGYRFPRIHSELAAIVRFPHSPEFLTKCALVNIRIGRSKKILLSKPCRFCTKLISVFGLKEVYYSNQSGEFERLADG